MDCVARQAPLSMGISRQGYWSGLPCPPPGGGQGQEVFPTQGWDPQLLSLVSPTLAGGFFINYFTFVVVQLLSHVQFFETPWTAAFQASLSFIISQHLLTFMSIEVVILSNHFNLCCLLLLLPSVFPNIRVFSNESALHQAAKVLELQI